MKLTIILKSNLSPLIPIYVSPICALYPYKRVFITGAASGLGRALCKQLAYDRWHIGICDTDARELEKTAKMIETLGGKAYSYCLDVSNAAEYEMVVGEFLSKTGGIDFFFGIEF